MSAAAKDATLKQSLADHAKETAGCVKIVEEVFGLLGMKASGEKCDATDGLIKEGEGVLEDFGDTAACDAGIIFCCQAVEHYEITRFGALREWAYEMELDEAAALLESAKVEHAEADDKLTDIAEARSNKKAEAGGKTKERANKAPTKPVAKAAKASAK